VVVEVVVVAGSGSLNSKNERFVTGPYPGPVDSTRVKVVEFPDGDVSLSGCHRPPSFGQSNRGPATEEEKAKKEENRARREILTVVKYFVLDHLWTITYRGPEFSRASLYVDLHAFERKVRRTYPDFAMIGVPELHQGGGVNHGGYHFHFAVNGFYDVGVLRRAWWSVVGEGMGNVQVESRHAWPVGKIANYMAKYLGKEFDTGRRPGEHRYRRSQNLTVPVRRLQFHGSRGAEREAQLKAWVIMASGRAIAREWHSDDGLQFLYRTFR
jgi:hypothetical protein